jgi:aminoglycoside phosphotransferase (APT) family kinase protein
MNDPREHFARLLDTERVAEALRRYLPECAAGDWRLDRCEIQHPRYKTYLSAENRDRSFISLVYYLRGSRSASTELENRILYARAFLGDRSRQVFEKALSVAVHRHRDEVFHLPELGLVGWRFPADPVLLQLAELMDVERAGRLIPGHTPSALEAIEVVNYRPEIRCTARYRLRASDSGKESAVYGKVYTDDRGQTIFRHLTAVREQSASAAAFSIPEPLGYDAALRVLWLESLAGKPLKDGLFGAAAEFPEDRLAEGLAAFHAVHLPGLDAVTAADLLQEWEKKARKLSHAYGDLGDSLASLLAELRQAQPENGRMGLIHGDFHVEQLALREGGQLALFDFDELACGDPLQDLANFCADLYSHSSNREAVDRRVAALVAAYGRAAGSALEPGRFIWHWRGQLLTRAYRAHIQQKTDTRRQVSRFIALALDPRSAESLPGNPMS